jgi:hypothetical protein
VTVVRGHGLQHEGQPVLAADCCGTTSNDRRRNSYDALGHGLCSCGEMSPCEDTTAARQRWHRLHKADVLERT